jgi:aminomethyltransferase
MKGYEALRSGAAWFDLSPRGRIIVAGDDRARLLHALSTNHVQQLAPGGGCYALFLNAQGRILADGNLLCLPDVILIDTEPEARERLFQHIDRYIIADDVTLEDASERLGCVAIEGPEAARALAERGAPAPEVFCSHEAWGLGRWSVRVSETGAPGWRVFLPSNEAADFTRGLEEADSEAVRTVRIEHAKARFPEDFSETTIAQEAQQPHALHFSKGCYLGQEIVERVRSRGHLNRLLVSLRIGTAAPPGAGAKLFREGAEVGEVTSAVWSPAQGQAAALGYVRAAHATPGSALMCEGSETRTGPLWTP